MSEDLVTILKSIRTELKGITERRDVIYSELCDIQRRIDDAKRFGVKDLQEKIEFYLQHTFFITDRDAAAIATELINIILNHDRQLLKITLNCPDCGEPIPDHEFRDLRWHCPKCGWD